MNNLLTDFILITSIIVLIVEATYILIDMIEDRVTFGGMVLLTATIVSIYAVYRLLGGY